MRVLNLPDQWGRQLFHSDITAQKADAFPQRPFMRTSSAPIWLIIALVALSPVIMAALSWTPDNRFSIWLYWIRFYAPPVLLIEMLAIGLAIRSGFSPLANIKAWPTVQALSLIGLITIAFSTAIFVAPDPATAVMRSTITLCHLLFGLSIFWLARCNKIFDFKALSVIVALSSLAYCLLMIVYAASITDVLRFDWLHFGLGVVNIRHTGFYIIPGAAVALGLVANERRPRYYAAGTMLIALCFAMNFWAGSRAPIMAIAAGTIGTVILTPHLRTSRLAIAFAGAVVLGGALSLINIPPDGHYGVFRIFSSATVEGVDVSSGRLDLWKSSLMVFPNHPFFGVGESQFITVVPGAISTFHHPHNVALQLLIQWGLAGLILASLLGLKLWATLLRVAKRHAQVAPLFLAINTLLIYAMIDGVFYFIYPMMILTFLIAICLGAAPADQSERPAA